jgi:hypothetical protein
MKRAAISLAVCVGLVVVGSAVCLPGVCGCYSWAGIPDMGEGGTTFLFLALAGFVGAMISFCWLLVASVRTLILRNRA